MMNISLPNIPEELKSLPQWVAWKYVQKDGRQTKLPYNPKTGALAEVDNPSTWGTIQEALIATERFNFLGIGFVFSQHDPFCGIDLDGCFDPTGKLEAWAQRYVDLFRSYTEITPSGKGLHIIVKGKLPERKGKPGKTGRRKGKFEVYDRERFFTFTGNLLNGTGGNRA